MYKSHNISGKDKWFVIVSFVYILYVIFPLFADLTQIQVQIPALLVVIYVAIAYPGTFTSKPVLWLVAYIAVLLVYTLLGKPIHINGTSEMLPTMWRITIEAAWIMPALLIGMILFKKNDARLYRIIGYGSIFLLILSFFYILPIITISSNILRADIYHESLDLPMGLPGYDLMHSYTLMLVPLCYMVKNTSGRYRLISLSVCVLFIYIIIKTYVTTSLAVGVMVVVLSIIYNEKRTSITIFGILLSILLIILLYQTGFFMWLVDALLPLFDGTAVQPKLEGLKESMRIGSLTGGHITGRIGLHSISKQSFLENPLFGGGEIGGHSKILDILGRSGLVVFIPFAATLWTMFRVQYNRPINKNTKVFIGLVYLAALIYLYQKGIFGAPGFLFMFVLAPSAIMAFDLRDNRG